jgi:hypothetical protein
MAAVRNHDGSFTEEELMAELKVRADLNHDGVVTQEEIGRAMQSGALAKTAETEKRPEEVQKK